MNNHPLTLNKNHRLSGFTIVELLIVIVVIGILAAISVVAYSGIQNRANDTIVRSEISSIAKKIHADSVDRGEFIPGGSAAGDSTRFPGFTYSVSTDSYETSIQSLNLFYCRGNDTSGKQVFRIDARSKSGNSYRYESSNGMTDLGSTLLSNSKVCENLTSTSMSYGFWKNSASGPVWWDWTK